MPKRTDLHKILIVGSGPIVIGQACEFDYFGTQACKALRREGYKTVLVNSNPATIMTDPEIADVTYIEPLTIESLTAIIRRERPDALLPTVGGQTALDLAIALADSGVLAECGVEIIGGPLDSIESSVDSILGWKKFEVELLHDCAGNVAVICVLESFDPVGVHSGDSIMVAPAQTLDKAQDRLLRDITVAAMREAGVGAGSANIQVALNPDNGEVRIIEINPRVSRSSALASKATGFPIARLATQLAVGYTLEELSKTPFESTIDRVVVRLPRWDFEKFTNAHDELGPQMKSVGEVMAFGRTLKEALCKGLRSIPSAQVQRLTRIDPWFPQQLSDETKAQAAYCYSARGDSGRKIVILGSGPNRIGQGAEFDYCCCHASFALREAGYETIMVNCNPAAVSTDYDTSDRLYLEPLTFEDVMNVVDIEKPNGVIVQFGGQTSLNLALPLLRAGVPIVGTSPESIDLAGDRNRLGALLDKLAIPQAPNAVAATLEETLEFLEQAARIGVDVLADESACVIAGIQEHIEEAGIHSGDSSCVLPPARIDPEHIETIRLYTRMMAKTLSVRGLMNAQFAIKDDRVYLLEVNQGASRTVPFVSKATGVPIAKIAALVMAGWKLKNFNLADELVVPRVFVRTPVFPFANFPEVDPILGPEMHATGEVMGIGDTFGEAYGKALLGAGLTLPQSGAAFISVNQRDKGEAVLLARRLARLGFKLMATAGTAVRLSEVGLEVEEVLKVNEGRPNIVDHIERGTVALIVNTPLNGVSHCDEHEIRRAALRYNIACATTMTGARAIVEAIRARAKGASAIRALQELHALTRRAAA